MDEASARRNSARDSSSIASGSPQSENGSDTSRVDEQSFRARENRGGAQLAFAMKRRDLEVDRVGAAQRLDPWLAMIKGRAGKPVERGAPRRQSVGPRRHASVRREQDYSIARTAPVIRTSADRKRRRSIHLSAKLSLKMNLPVPMPACEGAGRNAFMIMSRNTDDFHPEKNCQRRKRFREQDRQSIHSGCERQFLSGQRCDRAYHRELQAGQRRAQKCASVVSMSFAASDRPIRLTAPSTTAMSALTPPSPANIASGSTVATIRIRRMPWVHMS